MSETRQEERAPARRVLAGVLVLGLVLAVAAVAGGLLLSFAVSGPSMRPTLTDGDRILTNPLHGAVARFDVVALELPNGHGRAVKRVIGLPGDAIRITAGDSGDPRVLVRPAGQDGWFRVDQPSWAGAWGNSPRTCCAPTGSASQPDAAAVVPADSYFVLGDNPALSVDSRAFGWVPAARLTAPVLFRIWPPGPLADPPTLRPTP